MENHLARAESTRRVSTRLAYIENTIVEGLWARFKGLALALHRQDRLETARDFVGWLEALPADEAQIADIALNLTLRALHVASDPVNFRILQRLRRESSVSLTALMADMGLGRIPLHDRLHVLMQVGLAVQELESDDVRSTQLTDGIVDLVEHIQRNVQQAIADWLPEVV